MMVSCIICTYSGVLGWLVTDRSGRSPHDGLLQAAQPPVLGFARPAAQAGSDPGP